MKTQETLDRRGLPPLKPDHDSLGVLARVFRPIREVFNAAKPCRLALIVVFAVVFIFISVEQGSELLRCLGEGPAHTDGDRLGRFLFGVSGLVALSLSAWYFCRVLLSFEFADSPQETKLVNWVKLWLPRMIGLVPPLGLGIAFIHSASPVPKENHAHGDLIKYGLVYFAIAVLLLLFFWARREVLSKRPLTNRRFDPDDPDDKLPKVTLNILRFAACVSAVLFLLFLFKPVGVAQSIGSSAVIFLAAASWIVYGSLLIFYGHKHRFSVIVPALFVVAVFSCFNDNHAFRYLKGTSPGPSITLSNYYFSWYTNMAAKYPNEPSHPVIVVATAGGGIRAAFYTAIVLGHLQDTSPAFADHLFAISGVSGGSLGATVFDCLLKSGTRKGYRHDAQRILSRDFLSPTLAYFLFPDFIQLFIPVPIHGFDRAKALEMGWEAGWQHTMGNNDFTNQFDWLWQAGSKHSVPALFLNGTSVEQGNRMILSNVRIDDDGFLDSIDVRSNLAYSIRLSTAAHMSARFTYVSPAGLFANGQHIVDGGYFENSATATISDILDTIRAANDAMTNQATVAAIVINNDPNAAKARSRPARPSEFLHETLSPINTLLNTRDARGIYSEQDLKFRSDATRVYFQLTNSPVPLPLGWALSVSAMDEMNRQLDDAEQAAAVKQIADLLTGR